MRLPVWRTRCACWPTTQRHASACIGPPASLARTQGYGEVSVSGLKFSELLTAQKNPAVQVEPLQREQHQAQEHDGVEYDQSHIEGEHPQSKRRSRKPRKRSAARKAK